MQALLGAIVMKWRERDHLEAERHAKLVGPKVIHEDIEPSLRVSRREDIQIDDEILFSLLRSCRHFRPRDHEPSTSSVCRSGHSATWPKSLLTRQAPRLDNRNSEALGIRSAYRTKYEAAGCADWDGEEKFVARDHPTFTVASLPATFHLQHFQSVLRDAHRLSNMLTACCRAGIPHQCERLALQTEVPEGTRTFARVALDDATVGAASVAFRATFARPLCPRVAPAFARRVELATILTHVHISA